ncbi:MAG: amino acid permease [Gammaproteobacteria bacterium]|nr:amino acid permease [Gammaproteobacteria bacterium]
MNDKKITLKRSLSLSLITFYGLGSILGAGIYALIGKVAGAAGYYAPLSFVVASIIASFSALSYAELASRYPVSGGESVYLYEGFHLRWLSTAVGLLIVCAGIMSSAAISHGFAGYFKVLAVDYVPALQAVPSGAIITVLLLILAALAVWGIKQSVMVASLLTVVEMFGLGLVIWVGAEQWPVMEQTFNAIPGTDYNFSFIGIFAGGFLAFYAYLGFEDMVNVAEEAEEPQQNVPEAIVLAVIISTLLYACVAIVAVLLVDPNQLSKSGAPLAEVYTAATGSAPVVISLIGMFAVVNGALIQLIMASRLLYGMGSRGWISPWFSKIYSPTRTPINSTIVIATFITLFAVLLPIVRLAELTSFMILVVFILINLSLIRIKKRDPHPVGARVFSVWIPRLGFIFASLFLTLNIIRSISEILG